ncbi:MAG TPA: hypothetical protein VE871_13995 [Longimicrobium sp.]|nr:hypothetical protein [Longimicrobium sp.]
MSNLVFSGTVQSGGTNPGTTMRLASVPVTLFEATAGAPRHLGSAQTADDGRFTFDVIPAGSGGILYATARVDEHVLLAAIVGPAMRDVVINELTTVAAAFSMAQFAGGDEIGGDPFGLRIAAGMNDNLVDPATGHASPVLLAPPNADQSNTLRSTRSLANLVAACVRDTYGIRERFFGFTTPPHGTRPANTFQALLSIARNPANNAGTLYNQALGVPAVYAPALFAAPDAWTLAVKVNDSGDDDYLFGGPANIVFDHNGYAWIANNVVQGTPNSGTFIMVLQPDGKPADGRDGTPKSPVFGGGLKGPGWGITLSPTTRHVWVGNFGWGPESEMPVDGTASEFDERGNALSPDTGYQDDAIDRIQAIVADGDGNVWMASFGNGNVAVYPHGRTDDIQSHPSGDCPFGISIDRDGHAWVSNAGGLGWPQNPDGSVTRFRLQDGTLERTLEPVTVGKACKVIATDSLGNAWLASGGDSTVYHLDSSGAVVGAYTGVGGIDAPWGLAVDGDDNVWVGNFGVLGLESDYTRGALTQLAGANPATRPAGLRAGDPISPPTGYTLPSAGEPVLLRTGEPLYQDGTECYSPLMRSTGCSIDRAGNVWVVNNWKPRFRTNFETDTGNPGGDGIVIFVGLAKPPRMD